jgi:hypothetical protein
MQHPFLSSQLEIHLGNILLLLVATGLEMGASGLFTPLHFALCTIINEENQHWEWLHWLLCSSIN